MYHLQLLILEILKGAKLTRMDLHALVPYQLMGNLVIKLYYVVIGIHTYAYHLQMYMMQIDFNASMHTTMSTMANWSRVYYVAINIFL